MNATIEGIEKIVCGNWQISLREEKLEWSGSAQIQGLTCSKRVCSTLWDGLNRNICTSGIHGHYPFSGSTCRSKRMDYLSARCKIYIIHGKLNESLGNSHVAIKKRELNRRFKKGTLWSYTNITRSVQLYQSLFFEGNSWEVWIWTHLKSLYVEISS